MELRVDWARPELFRNSFWAAWGLHFFVFLKKRKKNLDKIDQRNISWKSKKKKKVWERQSMSNKRGEKGIGNKFHSSEFRCHSCIPIIGRLRLYTLKYTNWKRKYFFFLNAVHTPPIPKFSRPQREELHARRGVKTRITEPKVSTSNLILWKQFRVHFEGPSIIEWYTKNVPDPHRTFAHEFLIRKGSCCYSTVVFTWPRDLATASWPNQLVADVTLWQITFNIVRRSIDMTFSSIVELSFGFD